ncbi:hypothetical protein FGLOB1_1937 [Fusarium globosum]|uniref:Uncharacterized protein n=1 Tax=Fusarium globosum TaxID=78864 RepID=A0A8H5YT75_9HYPO|nr:hypothetical protein FGLOB1_1937 [Fusarium globosum]
MGYFSPTTRFYGPIRFGYLEYSQHFTQAYNVLIDWFVVFAMLAIFLPLPWLSFAFGTGVTAFCVMAWVRLVLLYRTSLRAIASEVAMDAGRARAAKAAAYDEACSFSRYEDQVMQAAGSARRDAVLSNAVRVTDFFDCTARAWSALGQVRQPAQTAAEKADFLVGAAADVLDTDMPDGDEETGESRLDPQAQELQENADEALRRAKDVVTQLEVAQEAIDRSNAANAQDRKARASAETNAMAAIQVARNISSKAAGLLVAKTAAERYADEVSVLAGQALSAAQGGEMARARQIADKAKTSADAAEAELVIVRAARAEALEDLLQWLESSRSGGS